MIRDAGIQQHTPIDHIAHDELYGLYRGINAFGELDTRLTDHIMSLRTEYDL